jgi:thiamine biosynthesis lipoprotein ApbE/Na+-translocating ferredoxin:NAD+ oxidoreductase RnfG subunit
MNPRLLNLLVRGWRLAALVLAALLLQRSAHHTPSATSSVSLETAREFFPSAARLATSGDDVVLASDAENQPLGTLVTTSPQADHITGYAGPSKLLVALDKDNRLAGLKILNSADTPSHVKNLQQNPSFAQSLRGWNPALEPPPKVDGIGGSTLTGLAMVEGIAHRLGGTQRSLRFPDPVSLQEIRSLFPGATSFVTDEPRKGWHRVNATDGSLAGFVVRTSPASDGLTGYAGPTECLVAINPDQQTLRSVRIRKSYDTDEYVERVAEDGDYLKFLTKWKVSEWPNLQFNDEKFEGVAGATLTSAGIAESIRARFKLDAQPPTEPDARPLPRDLALWTMLLLAALQSFTSLRGRPWVRAVWQALLIAVPGLWLGHFLSIGLFAGWAQNGLPWRQALPLVALASTALLVPWSARRQIYCHHICPHGAAQEWLGRFSKFKISLPDRLHRSLRLLPSLLLAFAFLAALNLPGIELSLFEPFDFWVLGRAAAIPAILALSGLALSAFIPMAYCRYGCPTGALLGFMRSSSNKERFGKQDALALVVLLGAFLIHPDSRHVAPTAEPTALRGTAFGTTWCVKIKGAVSNQEALHTALTREVERIEKTLSHWNKNSVTSRFNQSSSTEAQEIPEELGHLVHFALRLHEASDGDYDITVAPLVAAWGYGPPGETQEAPSPEKITRLLQESGSKKLTLNAAHNRLTKSSPRLALDLGSILQGYAADRLFAVLEKAGHAQFLIDVGGELRSKGPWPVAIEDPRDAARPLKVITLEDAALATSGLARARRKLAGETVSHIISPINGYPVNSTIEACSVSSPTCLEADGWSTAIIATGLPKAWELAKKEKLKVWMLDAAGNFKCSE